MGVHEFGFCGGAVGGRKPVHEVVFFRGRQCVLPARVGGEGTRGAVLGELAYDDAHVWLVVGVELFDVECDY